MSRTGLHRFTAEFLIFSRGSLEDALANGLQYNNFKRPQGWRLKVYKTLFRTLFKDLKKIDNNADETYRMGFAYGFVSNSMKKSFNLIKKDTEFKGGFPSLERFIEQKANWVEENSISRIIESIEEDSPDKVNPFLKGYTDGTQSLVFETENSLELSNTTDATAIYFWMLILGDFLESKRSVSHAYHVLKEYLGHEIMPHGEDSFKKICHRIGFVGRSYKRTKREINRQP